MGENGGESGSGDRLYGMADAADKQGLRPDGLRGERTDAGNVGHPELRHGAHLGGADSIKVEEASGVAFVDVIGTAGRGPDRADAPPPPQRSHVTMLFAAFATGLWIGSRRRRRQAPAAVEAVAVPTAFARPVADPASFDQTRDAGPEHIRDADGDSWDRVDEGSDESFPASDPPSYSRPER